MDNSDYEPSSVDVDNPAMSKALGLQISPAAVLAAAEDPTVIEKQARSHYFTGSLLIFQKFVAGQLTIPQQLEALAEWRRSGRVGQPDQAASAMQQLPPINIILPGAGQRVQAAAMTPVIDAVRVDE